MSAVGCEGTPKSDQEVEPTVSLDEARQEVIDTVDSIILAALDKAVKLEMRGSIDEINEIVKQLDTGDKLDLLAERESQLLATINNLRDKALVLAGGIRTNATNAELAVLIENLEALNQVWKSYVEDLKDEESLAAIMENVPYSIRTKSMATGKSTLLTPEVDMELKKSEKPRR